MKNHKKQKGFTLIELLVVIAIIAVLSVVVILTLNPAELLRQARDSNRISDFATMKSAISLFEADVTTSSVTALGTYTKLYSGSANATTTTSTYVGVGSLNWGFASGSVSFAGAAAITTSSNRTVDGTGWIPVNFNLISSGSPIGSEAVDPANNSTNYYVYAATSTTFKFAVKVESAKYGYQGGSDIVSTDGGNNTSTFEGGTNLQL